LDELLVFGETQVFQQGILKVVQIVSDLHPLDRKELLESSNASDFSVFRFRKTFDVARNNVTRRRLFGGVDLENDIVFVIRGLQGFPVLAVERSLGKKANEIRAIGYGLSNRGFEVIARGNVFHIPEDLKARFGQIPIERRSVKCPVFTTIGDKHIILIKHKRPLGLS